MAHAFALELLWLFSRPQERHGFPSLGHRYCPEASGTPKGYLVRIYHAWSLSLILFVCFPTVRLADTRPNSPTALAYESTAHPYYLLRFFRLPFVTLARIA
jgi:hypothetical protein